MRGLSMAGGGYEIVHVTDGEAAIAYLEGCAIAAKPHPRLLLLDLRLPKLDGLQVLARLRASAMFATIPVVVLSTSASPADIGRAYALHVNSYLVKPLDFPTLAHMMTTLSNYWLQWNQTAA